MPLWWLDEEILVEGRIGHRLLVCLKGGKESEGFNRPESNTDSIKLGSVLVLTRGSLHLFTERKLNLRSYKGGNHQWFVR